MKKSAWFSFKNKDSPDYVSSYGDTYTDRQLAILNNEIPLYEIRPNELSILYKKAKQKNDVVHTRLLYKCMLKKQSLRNIFLNTQSRKQRLFCKN